MSDVSEKFRGNVRIPDGAPVPAAGPVVKPATKPRITKGATAIARVAEALAASPAATAAPPPLVIEASSLPAPDNPASSVPVPFDFAAATAVPADVVENVGAVVAGRSQTLALAAPEPSVASAIEEPQGARLEAVRSLQEPIRLAMAEVAATSKGAFEVHAKVLDALRAQSEAAFDLWRSTLTAGSISGAVEAHTSGARHLYQTAAHEWRGVADVTTRWVGATVKPYQSAWTDRSR